MPNEGTVVSCGEVHWGEGDRPLKSTLLGSVSIVGLRDRLRQVGVGFARVALQNCESDDLALVVDGACGFQVQSGVLRNQRIHVGGGAVAPKRGPGAEAGADGNAQHHAIVADGGGGAVGVTGHSSKIGDVALLPEKSMKARVGSGVRGSHNLAFIVQASGIDAGKSAVSAKVAEVDGVAVAPQNGVKWDQIVLLKHIERPAIPGGADCLAEIVDRVCNTVRIAVNGGKLLGVHRGP